jgi:hypothetical protein
VNDLNYGRSEELQISLNDAQVQLKTPADDQLEKKIYSLVHLQQKLSSAFVTSLDSRLSLLLWISADELAVRNLYRSSSCCVQELLLWNSAAKLARSWGANLRVVRLTT